MSTVAPDDIVVNTSDWIVNSAEQVADELNKGYGRDDRYILSYNQTRKALRAFLEDEIEKLQEDLEKRFLGLDGKTQDRYLGEPERDRAQDAKDEYADYLYDVSRGN